MGAQRQGGYWAAVMAVVAAWTALGWPWLSGRVTIPYDAKAHFYPQLQFLAQALHSGQSPFWAPGVFAGSPQIADPQSLIFSPAILVALMTPNPSFRALDVYVLLLLLAAALAVVMLFRDRNWHPAGATAAGIAYAFGGSAAWRLQHIKQVQSYALLAIAIWLLARALQRGGIWRGVLAGAAAGVMAVEAGQEALLACYVLAGLVVARPSREEVPRRGLWALAPVLVASAVTALAIMALPVLMTYQFVQVSNRTDIPFVDAGRGSLPPAALLTLLIGDFFSAGRQTVGYWGPPSADWNADGLALAQNMAVVYSGALAAVALIALGFVRGLLWRREIAFYSIAFLIATFYALGWYTPVFRLIYEVVPAVHLFRRPADASFLMGGMLAIVAGYLIHVAASDGAETSWSEMRSAKTLLAVVFALAVAIAAWKGHLRDALLPLVVSGVLVTAALGLISLLPRLSAPSAVALVALLSIVDLRIYNGPNGATALPPKQYAILARPSEEPTVEFLKARLDTRNEPARRDRVELLGLGFEWPNASLVHGFDHVLGYNPLRLHDYVEAVGAEDTIAVPEQRRFTRLFPGYDSLLARLVGLRYVASRVPIEQVDPTLRGDVVRLVETTASARIYELPRPYPRVMFAAEAQPADFQRIVQTGRWPQFDPELTVLLAPGDMPRPQTPDVTLIRLAQAAAPLNEPDVEAVVPRAGSVRIVRYENTLVEIEASASREGYVVLNDVWHPWWRATVDGVPAPIFKANVLFRAVAVPAGRHVVRFEFAPVSGSIAELVAKVRSKVRPARFPVSPPAPVVSGGPVPSSGASSSDAHASEPRTH